MKNLGAQDIISRLQCTPFSLCRSAPFTVPSMFYTNVDTVARRLFFTVSVPLISVTPVTATTQQSITNQHPAYPNVLQVTRKYTWALFLFVTTNYPFLSYYFVFLINKLFAFLSFNKLLVNFDYDSLSVFIKIYK